MLASHFLHTVCTELHRHPAVATLSTYIHWKMEDDHTYHNRQVHDNTIHHMVLTTYFSMHVQNLLNHLITLSGMSIDYSVIIHHILTQVWFGGSVGVIGWKLTKPNQNPTKLDQKRMNQLSSFIDSSFACWFRLLGNISFHQQSRLWAVDHR